MMPEHKTIKDMTWVDSVALRRLCEIERLARAVVEEFASGSPGFWNQTTEEADLLRQLRAALGEGDDV